MGDAVGDVLELLRRELIIILEKGVLENLTVKSGNTVDAVAGRNTKVRHTDNTVCNNGKLVYLSGVAGCAPDISTIAVVDFLDNLINSREKRSEKILGPTFKRFFHDRVVGVSHRFGDDLPGVVPFVAALVKQNTHQLRNGKRGMRVVDVNGVLLGKVCHGGEVAQMTLDDVLNRSGNKEILLL